MQRAFTEMGEQAPLPATAGFQNKSDNRIRQTTILPLKPWTNSNLTKTPLSVRTLNERPETLLCGAGIRKTDRRTIKGVVGVVRLRDYRVGEKAFSLLITADSVVDYDHTIYAKPPKQILPVRRYLVSGGTASLSSTTLTALRSFPGNS
jgi:hypothetical protein